MTQPMQRSKLLTVAALLSLGLIPVVADATPQQAGPAKDQHGDALPAGALARLGSGRFRHGSTVGLAQARLVLAPTAVLVASGCDASYW